MKIKLDNIIIRAFEHKDEEDIFRIVREKEILRFMADWAENGNKIELLHFFKIMIIERSSCYIIYIFNANRIY